MILTQKCLEDFNLWHFENCNVFEYKNFHELSENLQYALIIEFFEYQEIYVTITRVFPIWIYGYSYSIDLDSCKEHFKTRQEATKAAIEKANEIYNNI